MNVQELRDLVRYQMDLDEEDLPNQLVDGYLREGYQETINMGRDWPFFQHSWEVVVPEGENSVTRPTDLGQVASVVDVVSGVRLHQASYDEVESNGLARGGTSVPNLYTLWGGEILFWPASNAERTYRVRGWRTPIDWVGQGAGGVVDADERLHSLLVHYAVSRAYAQQEDEVLEAIYRDKWLASSGAARTAIMRPDHGKPIVFNGGLGFPRRVSAKWRFF